MKPDREKLTVTSTVQGEDIAMSVDQNALAHIMNILTDIYSDNELAVIREYSTNALDSHVEAGSSRPIEVITPTHLRPLLTIRDFGVGLSAEDIRDIYSRYGASTKRETNDAVGMLGIGCKSALAYTDQFTLTGIKDGNRIVVSISRDETGAGTMTVLERGETDEHDGVEISVPTRGGDLFELKAEEFFAHWEPGTVLLNGEEPSAVAGWRVNDRFTVATREYNYESKLTVVMGNVPYPAPDDYARESEILSSLPGDQKIVARVPIGTVQFAPSREALQDHPATRAALDQVLAEFRDACRQAIHEQVESAESRPAAAAALIKARAAIGRKNVGEVEWRGEEIPVVIEAGDLGDQLPNGQKPKIWRASVVTGYRGAQSHRAPAGQISLDDAARFPWALGFDNSTWNATMRRKLIRYLTHHNMIDAENASKLPVYITNADEVPRPEWIDGAVTAVSWPEVRKWKDPDRAQGGRAGGGESYAGTYPTWHGGYWSKKFEASELPRFGRNLYYVEGESRLVRNQGMAELLDGDTYLVELAPNRAAKFKRLFPHARPAREYAQRSIAGRWESLSGEEQAAFLIGHDIRGSITSLPPDELDDPSLRVLLEIQKVSEESTRLEKFRVLSRNSGLFDPPTLGELGLEDWDAIPARYPLLTEVYSGRLSGKMLKHLTIYVNAVYAALTDKEDS